MLISRSISTEADEREWREKEAEGKDGRRRQVDQHMHKRIGRRTAGWTNMVKIIIKTTSVVQITIVIISMLKIIIITTSVLQIIIIIISVLKIIIYNELALDHIRS